MQNANKPSKQASKNGISSSVIKRLPRYYRFIGELVAQGIIRSSSSELAEKMSLTASQIRQDLNCFGGFGQQGYGYNLLELHQEIAKILGINQAHKAILFGAGNFGKAIATHMNFQKYGANLVGIFDSDPQKQGEKIADMEINSIDCLESFCKENNPKIAILCVPKAAVQGIVDKLLALNINAFWNFSHYDIKINNENVVVESVHLADSLMRLSYGITHEEN